MHANLIVVDDLAELSGFELDGYLISFEQYLADHPKKGVSKARLINLCNSTQYLSKGYYCSLLAEARGHKVLPSVNTMNDLRNEQLYKLKISGALLPKISKDSQIYQDETLEFYIFFGQTQVAGFESLAKQLFSIFSAPILHLTLETGVWSIKSISFRSLSDLTQTEKEKFVEALFKFNQKLWSQQKPKKQYRWDMAILVNPEEKLPPSDKTAINKMLKAANKVGINAELIGPNDISRLTEFDALFIRETTAIDHHTYRFARKAQLEGMVVIDDPASILRCCNKVFLQDAFTYNKVPALKTISVSSSCENTVAEIEKDFSYPVVLKVPEGAFSLGVFKVKDRAELVESLNRLLEKSALVLVQTYMYTEFDWRIGVLNNKPLFACKYFMARNHWQIYNHSAKRGVSGGFETLPTFEVPKVVLDAALRASKVIGNGLYGVDIKQQGKQAYVIEINDNPSLDSGVEDVYLGDELYMIIMSEMARRLELRGR
ncbi:RimK family protein [Catenovulum sp. 2E275]|uniref:RimK family protein n=1 Tax=Catenovulum sp. 2E275 TaxID=2980497 RepID=UPI0021D0C046|nr:RimK family protein [Catenovulum sp. 2E275]MCU4675807.1 RimK family protein [Catenovulum sp. 2E275]